MGDIHPHSRCDTNPKLQWAILLLHRTTCLSRGMTWVRRINREVRAVKDREDKVDMDIHIPRDRKEALTRACLGLQK